MKNFSHMKSDGSSRMVDVTGKEKTLREAQAIGKISVSSRVVALLKEDKLPKGNLFEVAKVAGVMAAKKTSHLVPLCHQIPLDVCEVDIDLDEEAKEIRIVSDVRARWSTGVEMEALVAVSISAVTVYDMIKSVDRDAVIGDIKVLKKKGGKSGDYVRKSD